MQRKAPALGPLHPGADPKLAQSLAGGGRDRAGREGPACGRGSFAAAGLEPGPSLGRRHCPRRRRRRGGGWGEREEKKEEKRELDRQIFCTATAPNNQAPSMPK